MLAQGCGEVAARGRTRPWTNALCPVICFLTDVLQVPPAPGGKEKPKDGLQTAWVGLCRWSSKAGP